MRRRTHGLLALLVVVFLILGLGAASCDKKKTATALTEAVGSQGTNPFSANALGQDARNLVSTGKGGKRQGDTPGLYGGSLKKTVCDKNALISFLTDPANAAKARAWAKAAGVDVDAIPAYVRALTPVLLRTDTLVKNHGFTDGKANAYLSILQAGMAVLVGSDGAPAVKCNCGNPLKSPGAAPADVKVKGGDPTWPGFDKKKAARVAPAKPKGTPQPIVLKDVETGAGITRPSGTDGNADVKTPPPAEPDVSPSPSVSSSGSPSSSTSTSPSLRPSTSRPPASPASKSATPKPSLKGSLPVFTTKPAQP